MTKKTKYLSKTHNQHGNKHPGMYGTTKEILPTPKSAHMNINIPFGYICAIQDRYPELTPYKAVQKFIMENISPLDILR